MQNQSESIFSRLLSFVGLNKSTPSTPFSETPPPRRIDESTRPVPTQNRPLPPPVRPQPKKEETLPPSLFLSDSLYDDESIAQQVKKEIFDWAKDHLGVEFTPAQQAFILSPTRSTLVDAGAGSGKSTTLAWRILFLHRYCNVALTEITVFSFTRASCEDLRSKIKKTFNGFGIPINDCDVKRIVRTFHSKLFEWSRTTGLLGENDQLFEFLNDKNAPSIGDEEGLDIDNQGISTQFNTQQLYQIRNCHRSLYKASESYRSLIDALEWQVLLLPPTDCDYAEIESRIWEKIVKRDKALTHAGNQIFDELGSLATETSHELVMETSHGRYVLNANYYFPECDLYAVVVPVLDICRERKLEERFPEINGRYLSTAFTDKAKAIALYSRCNVAFIETPSDAEHLVDYLRRVSVTDGQEVPIFDLRLSGDYRSSEILDQFMDAATFTESIGIDVTALDKARKQTDLCSIDDLFVASLCQFWPVWIQHLRDQNMVRFPTLMQAFGKSDKFHFQELPDRALTSMKHLFIDEFQDISTLEVNWITATLRYLKSLPFSTSLTCVGDDYQSIYGWRGSSTAFITEFDRWFPSQRTTTRIVMEDNFRSYQNIVNSAESLLRKLSVPAEKHGRCFLGEGGNGVAIETYGSKHKAQMLADAVTRIHDYRSELVSRNKREEAAILVLGRSNAVLDSIKDMFNKSTDDDQTEDVRFETFHRSKGLESRYAVLVEDCCYTAENPVRNMIYAQADFPASYDTAQSDEAMRLAYVGVTRAMHSVTWFGVRRYGGALEVLD